MMRHLFFVGMLLTLTGTSRAATRVALVVGGAGPDIRAVIDLATVKLSEEKGVELLERAGIERVLAEQKLTLSGLADAGQAVAAGKLLSADVLAVVEIAPDGKAVLGLVAFDAKTGLRLWDAALDAGGVEKQAEGISAGVKAALKKQTAGLVTVGFVAVRNADLPRPMDSFCEALAQLIERRLVAAPKVGVLERQRLEAVTGERALPTQGAEKELLGALVQLDLEVRRGPRGEGLAVTVLLRDAGGKQLARLAVPVNEKDRLAAVDTLAKDICVALKATPAAGDGDPVREAGRYAREARQAWSFKQPVRAIRAVEAAVALAPTDVALRTLLAEYLFSHGGNLITPSGKPLFNVRLDNPDHLFLACGLVLRGLEMSSSTLAGLDRKDAQKVFEQSLRLGAAAAALQQALSATAALNQRILTAEGKQLLIDLGAAVDRWIGDEYLEALAGATERQPAFFEMYSGLLFQHTAILRSAAPNATHFTRKLIAVTERWLLVFDKFPQGYSGGETSTMAWRMLTQTSQVGVVPLRWSPGPAEVTLLVGLFAKMEKHKHPLIRLQGRCGHLWAGLQKMQLSPQECYTELVKARTDTLATIRDPQRRFGLPMLIGYYRLILEFSVGDSLGLRTAGKSLTELYTACEEMLGENLIVHNLALIAVNLEHDKSVTPARRLALIDRLLAAVANPRMISAGGKAESMKSHLEALRVNLLTAHPELAGKDLQLPWDRITLLADVADLPDIRVIRSPTVIGEQVYFLGLGGGRNAGFMQLYRVPRSGGTARPLGKVSVSFNPFPPLGPHTPLSETVTGVQADTKRLYVATRSNGLFAFPLNGGPGERLDEGKGLPSEGFEAITLYNERLYAALAGGYLVSLSPESGKFEVLASSRRREKASPFDDGEAFMVTYLGADPPRQRLVFLLHQGKMKTAEASGLWAWDLKTRDFTRLLKTGGINRQMAAGPLRDDRLLLRTTTLALEVDLTRDKATMLWGWGDPHDGGLDPRKALCYQYFRAHPELYRDGWLWCFPLGRINITQKKHELFPLPKRTKDEPVGPLEYLQDVGKDQLLVGSASVVWVLSLRKER